MKVKKALSIIMSVVLLFSVFSVGAYADESSGVVSFKIENVAKDMLSYKYNITAHASTGKFAGSDEGYRLYDCLSEEAQAIYRQFVADKAGLISAPQGLIRLNLSAYGEYYTEYSITEAICYACAALSDDQPEYQWLLSAPFYVEYDDSNGVLELEVQMSELPYDSWWEIQAEYNELLSAVNSFEISGISRYELVKSIHDNLAYLASYSKDLDNNTSPINSKIFYPSSALLAPYETVCDGYAKAFKMICDKYKIPCIVVTGYGYNPIGILGLLLVGGGHSWNYVKMEDGEWYAVDLTWDDVPDSDPSYDYFLVGSSTRDKSGYPFIRTHDPVGDRFRYTYLEYPQLSSSKYVYNPSTSEAVLGDVNGDGRITVVDAKWILQNVASLRKLSPEQTAVADVNNDSRITVADSKMILKIIAGEIV